MTLNTIDHQDETQSFEFEEGRETKMPNPSLKQMFFPGRIGINYRYAVNNRGDIVQEKCY